MRKRMVHQTHFFFAVKLPEETKIILKEHCEKLMSVISFNRWVHYEDLHITLAFLGHAPTERLRNAEKNVSIAINGLKPFNLRINQLGIFGKHDSPRIVYADVEESNELQLIRQKVFTACEEAGFKLESRPFRPHITLARRWEGDKPFHIDLLHIWKDFQSEPIEFEAAAVVLYQTHLHKTPKYEAIRFFSLDKTFIIRQDN